MTAETGQLGLAHWGAFTAEVENGRLARIQPFARDPFPSEMIAAIPDLVHGPTRVRHPVVRRGFLDGGPGHRTEARGRDPFVRVSWDEALDLVARELSRVRESHGNAAILGGSYGWSSAGRLHHARTLLRRFLFAFGGCTDQLTNYSWGAAQVLLPHVIGTYAPVTGCGTAWPSLIRHTGLVVAFGGLNPKNGAVSSGGAGEHSMERHLRAAAEAGIECVVISPVRDDIPPFLAAEWLALRPNTDAALMLGLCFALLEADRHDRAFLDRYCEGFPAFERHLRGLDDGVGKTPEWAEAITQVPAATIRALALRMAGTCTFLTASWSLQRADHGEQAFFALIALAAMLGQIGLPGGGFGFGYGSIDGTGNPRPPVPVPSMPMGRNPIESAIPVARLADCLQEPGATIDFDGARITYPDIRLVYWAGGNPFHHHQDLNRLQAAWRRPEVVVVHEIAWTATARQADIVLPATTAFERDDIGASSRDRFVVAMKRLVPPQAEARDDFAILSDLARRLGCLDRFTEGRDAMGWLRHLYARAFDGVDDVPMLVGGVPTNGAPSFERFWEAGWLELVAGPREDGEVLFADFRADPLGNPLATPSGRIELYSSRIASFGYDDCPPHPAWIEPAEWLGGEAAERFPLHLITSQPRNRLHAQMDPGPVSAAGKIAGREPLWIHPDDATRRGVADGQVVRVYNDRGACLAGAKVTDSVRPGVVQLCTGAWFDPAEPGRPGSLEKHGNSNVLTRDRGTSRLAQGCSAMTALVEVEPFHGAPPPVGAHLPPEGA